MHQSILPAGTPSAHAQAELVHLHTPCPHLHPNTLSCCRFLHGLARRTKKKKKRQKEREGKSEKEWRKT